MILKYRQAPSLWQRNVLISLGVFSLFGYVLYFILFWLAWAAAFFSKKIIFWKKNAKILIGSGLIVFLAAVIPALEIIFGYSHFDSKINWLKQIAQIVGNFSGYYLANGPRPHVIAVGNIIFNQIPSYVFVANAFTAWRWWIPVLMFLFLFLFCYGIYWLLSKAESIGLFWTIICFAIIGSYFISRYFLVGENILARRLDVVIALLILVPIFSALRQRYKNLHETKPKLAAASLIIAILVLSMAMAASYSLGPDTDSLSIDQYQAMNYVWQAEKNNNNSCVLADTYPLLALEYLSEESIIGGGFPIDQYFAQPERAKFFNSAAENLNQTILKSAAEETKADHCWYVGESKNTSLKPVAMFGKIGVWRYN